ncbi:MarR family winged helix-turn-helix transcriptional regulator [Kineococcus rhizosphaerae]|uniref:DNA-binding MarR family transcriptional regulator n=1 Tax=Kineococcus rhizosphaerae TaxID=559628 RepID=A0A2T0QK41_9ACTN|nr:MarR family transcriptional regulator [Kineococcus rhizosphaerae]PRY04639.1 DNA-binding MarR family transcriptional regulator [Kineococcus rhizosphaerae]
MANEAGNPRAEVVRLTQRLVAEAEEVAHAFVLRQGMHSTDVDALLRVMATEGRGEAMTAGALGRELRLSTGAITAVVDRLEKSGALVRVRDGGDRRKVLVETTSRGRALAEEYSGPVRARIDEVLDQFSAGQLDVVSRYLAAAADAMAAHRRHLMSAVQTLDARTRDPRKP